MNTETTPRRRRRFRLTNGGRVLLFAVLAAAIFFGYIGFRLWQAGNRLRETTEEISRNEPGWQLADLEAKRITPPDDENAALVIVKIKEQMPEGWPSNQLSNATESPALNEKLDPGKATLLANEMEKIAAITALARKLNDLPKGRFPHEWSGADWLPSAPLNHLQLPRWATVVLYHSSIDCIQRGQLDIALENCAGMLNAGSSLSKDPSSTAVLVRNACAQSAVSVLERIFAQGTPADAALQSLQKRIEREASEPVLLDLLIGERALLHQCLQDARDKKFVNNQLPRDIYSLRSHEFQLAMWTEAVAIARSEPDAAYVPLTAYFSAIAGGDGIPGGNRRSLKDVDEATEVLLGLSIPANLKILESVTFTRARLRCAEAAIAAERFRRVENKWPEKPEQLVPTYLSEWPKDPFDGKPMRYRRLDSGRLVIYSIGPDGIDDGGRLNRKDMRAKNSDGGIELFPVAERGRPFAPKKEAPKER